MAERSWEIGICGTFDVANYGDLLFPLIAEKELTERLGAVTLHRFSYHPKTPPEWPFEVTSVTALPGMINRLDGLLIGGGLLIRFDKQVAPEYFPPTPEIHHPTGYWLTPALIALQHDVPVVWNAPGTDGRSIPAWANPLTEKVLTHSRYVSVRDEHSRSALVPLSKTPVTIVPDTAFALGRLLNLEDAASAEFTRLCEASGLDGPYIVVQSKPGLEGFIHFIKKHPERFANLRILVLPIGPVLGDRSEAIDADLPHIVRLPYWPSPLVIAELIGRSEAVVGQSYHLCITALASGVPVFARYGLPACKYSVLRRFETYFELPLSGEPDLEWFFARVGKTRPSEAARSNCVALGNHWDRVAAVLRANVAPTAACLDRFWQSLPILLEEAARESAERQDSLDGAVRQLTVARAETAARDARIAEILGSMSWKLTAPLRFIGRYVRKHPRRNLMDLASIGRHGLETHPYGWAAIDRLFTPDDAVRLATTYPCDHFKLVSRSDAERYYEYEARSLIGMGADAISFPDDLSDAWRMLALDFLSPQYRAAMTKLTGCDLTHAPMEVNVFHYGPGGSMDPHQDLPAKVVTHVLYFNRSWNAADGGCLRILGSPDPADVVAEIQPLVGNSSVIIRSENSWHAVSRVASDSAVSRRSVTVTFYRPGSVSTMWPPGDTTPLHTYYAADLT
jgi:hypothetical protein